MPTSPDHLPRDAARDLRASLLVLALGAAVLLAAGALYAQPSAAQPVATLDTTLVAALAGRWSCAGAFANGRPIEATIAISPELDGRALLVRHDDRPPAGWHALAIWRADSGGRVVATLHDNAGAPRLFAAAPWDGRTLRLQSPAGGARRDRFSYAATAAGFEMTYEVSADGATWRLGDRLACTR